MKSVTCNHALKCDAASVRDRLTALGVELPVIAVPAAARDSNWDLWIGVHGECAAVPTAESKAGGCKSSGFGDPNYLRGHIVREGAEVASHVDPVILGALGLAVVERPIESCANCYTDFAEPQLFDRRGYCEGCQQTYPGAVT